MSTNIPSQYILQYDTDTKLAYQFAGDKLMPYVTMAPHQGEGAAPCDFVAATHANENPGRIAPTPMNNASVTRRWVYPTFFDHAHYIAKQDETRVFNGGNLQSQYAKNQGLAMSRKRDDLIMAATVATAVTGKNGGSTTAFDTGMSVANNYKAAAATGLTVAKLIRMKKLMRAQGIDLENEKLVCLINSDDEEFLLNQIELRSKDYNDKPVLVDGQLRSFLGFTFIKIEYNNATYYPNAAAALVSGSDRYAMCWVSSAMYWGNWRDIETDIAERKDLSRAIQMYAIGEGGATRLQEGGVGRIIVQ